MPSYMLRGLPEGLVSRAKAKAREAGTTLDAVLIRFIYHYAEHGSIQTTGGHTRAQNLTSEERSASAKKASEARWHKPE